MQVHLYATFRLLAGVKTLTIDLPAGSSVRQLVQAVISQAPALRKHWLDAQGEIHAHVHGFVNGTDVAQLPGGWDAPLQPDDTIDFFPPVAGG